MLSLNFLVNKNNNIVPNPDPIHDNIIPFKNPKNIAFPVHIPIKGNAGMKLSTKQLIKPINIVKIQ